MRSRNIKPGFFENEQLAELPALTRLLYIGLWCYADREGRFEWRPKRIKAKLFPYDTCDVDLMLNDLVNSNFIQRYSASTELYGLIPNFLKHQNPHHRENFSELPAPPETIEEDESPGKAPEKPQAFPGLITTKARPSPADSLIPDSLIPDSLIPDIRIEDIPVSHPETFTPMIPNKRENKRKKEIEAKPIPIPPDFSISERVEAWATRNRHTRLPERLAHFRKWVENAENRGVTKKYKDWDKAFMNAIEGDWAKLNSVDYQQGGKPPYIRTPPNNRPTMFTSSDQDDWARKTTKAQ